MENNRFFNAGQREELFLRSNGKCHICNEQISIDNFHADHIIPFASGGKTNLDNGQALCPKCNLEKSSLLKLDFSSRLPAGWTLRTWQDEFVNKGFRSILQQLNKSPSEIEAFMLYAFPASGKTLASLLIGALLLDKGLIEKIIVLVPTDYLRTQMVGDGEQIGLHFDGKDYRTDKKFDGIVTTYQMLGSKCRDTGRFNKAELLRKVCQDYKTLVIADECHHIGERNSWGEAFTHAFSLSIARLMTSGTYFRTDGQRLPWTRYWRRKIDLSPPHAYAYGYGMNEWNDSLCALKDHVATDIIFHPWDGIVNFTIKERNNQTGELREQEFKLKMSDNIDIKYACEFDSHGQRIIDNRRLRYILKRKRRLACIECGTPKHPYGTEYVREQLIAANKQLNECRRFHPWAGGLIICHDIRHADAVAKALKKWTNEDAEVIHSESGNNRTIEKFKNNTTPSRKKWICAVGKISEGVNIKFLRVCVYLTPIQAPLKWTQIVGRILRVEKKLPWEKQTAHFFQYDDGIELVENENGERVPESVNIKLFAETLWNEKLSTQSVLDQRRETRRDTNGDGTPMVDISSEVISAIGFNKEKIYAGERIANKEVEKFAVMSAKSGWPEVTLAKLFKDIGEEEIRKILKISN